VDLDSTTIGFNLLTWLAMAICVSQSAMFSGLNLAVFSLSKLRLEMEVAQGNERARRVLALREDANLLLTTILWGNVAINVLLALLADSVMVPVAAFLFSTVVITFLGEILPQAYFSRYALVCAARFAPLLRFYRWLLYPVTKPSAWLLDRWLGPEAIQYFQERDLEDLLRMHIQSPETDIDAVEGRGALNFLAIDDIPVREVGEPVDPLSVVTVPGVRSRRSLTEFQRSVDDPFLRRVQASRKKWVIVTDRHGEPCWVIDADGFLRCALFGDQRCYLHRFVHRPILVQDSDMPLGQAIRLLKGQSTVVEDEAIDHDLILLWDGEKRVITGADLLGRLLVGIA
jgi:hypothetical protein